MLTKWQEIILYDAVYGGGNPPLPNSGHRYSLLAQYANKKAFLEFEGYAEFRVEIAKLQELRLAGIANGDDLEIPDRVALNAIEKLLRKKKKREKRLEFWREVKRKGATYMLPAAGAVVGSLITTAVTNYFTPDIAPAIKGMAENVAAIRSDLILKDDIVKSIQKLERSLEDQRLKNK